MKYLYWIGVVAVLAGGLWAASFIGSQPDTVSKVEFVQVETPEQFGAQVFEKIKDKVKASPIAFFGVTPGQIEDLEMWRGFFEANQEPGSKYDVIVVEPMLPYVELFESNMRIDIKEDMARFVEGVNNARKQGLRVAVFVPTIYSTQLLKRNPADRLKSEFKLDFLSLSVVKFPVTREQEASFEPRCEHDDGRDITGTGTLGCLIQEKARRTYLLKVEDNKYSAFFEQAAENEYLVFLNRNAGSR